jgi:tetratricopeptide (TPR) repeat protein
MTRNKDDKKPIEGIGPMEWDEALSEWDDKGFTPEVAKEIPSDRTTPTGNQAPPRTLYRPPTPGARVNRPKGPLPIPTPPAEGTPVAPATPVPEAAAARTVSPLPSNARVTTTPPKALDENEGEETLIAAVPRELLRGDEGGPKASSHAGLGQLFSRDERKEASIDVSFDESQGRIPSVAPKSDPSEDVFTSAKSVDHSRSVPSEPAPLRRLSLVDASERVPDGAMFDPFFEPEATASTSTVPPPRAPSVAPAGPASLEHTLVSGRPERSQADVAAAANASTVPPAESGQEPPARAPLPPALPHGASLATARTERPPAPGRTWTNEREASAWLDDAARAELASKGEWLEAEARAVAEKGARARGLLVCSELAALAGLPDRVHELAREARNLAPALALAHRQARASMPRPRSDDEWLAALDVELKMTPAGPARIHSALMAANAARAVGDDEGAAKRLEQAARISNGDVRAAVWRAARALAQGELTHPALRLPDSQEMSPLAAAVSAVLRLRGVDREPGAATQPRGPDAGAPGGAAPNELLLRARKLLEKGDTGAAAVVVARLAGVPELAPAALWLASSLGATRANRRADAVGWLRELSARGDRDASRALVARALELGDRQAIEAAVRSSDALSPAERILLEALAGVPVSPADADLVAAAREPATQALSAAVAALAAPEGSIEHAQVRARASAGTASSRALVRLGRLLAAGAEADLESAIADVAEVRPPVARALRLELAARTGRWGEVSAALTAWATEREATDERAAAAFAGALVAERAGDRERALAAYKAVRAADPTNEAALRAIDSLEPLDLVAEMNALADELADGPRSAVARLEAVARAEGVLPEPTRAEMLERAHRAAPSLAVAAFLAERIHRRAGDVEEVLHWVRERRANTADPLEIALDSTREALLVADGNPELAAERLQEAHKARPADVALRTLYERLAPEPPEDAGSWREQRASEATGDARALFSLDAAREYERAGDIAAALRCAEAASTGQSSDETPQPGSASGDTLARVVRERIEMRSENVARLAEELLSAAKGAGDPRSRREAYERLAVLDATARKDPASAVLWHRTILEEVPDHIPSLRHVEHHLIGEGREEELEPVASAIAGVLRGTGPGECTAHAELAARLRLRGVAGSWEATRELVALAANEGEPSLWALRMQQAHARSHGEDAMYYSTTLQLLERATRASEETALLVSAGETAARLGKAREAQLLLERAVAADAGDMVAWGLLARVRLAGGHASGAAEANEAVARSSSVHEHQLGAWYEAGRIWQDDVRDDERAILAFESAVAIDVSYKDTFDRLSLVYAGRKMHAELASLLERKLASVSDVEERLRVQVRRGRVLLDLGDADSARQAFESALSERPDDPEGLSAFADLCVTQRDWDAGEQALVRLARLLPTPDQQRGVYARLGDLYSRHLVNLARAEVALKEVLKRAPEDLPTMEHLVDVYKRQSDATRAAELQQELAGRARSPDEKKKRLLELAQIHEQTGHDNRRAEQTLEAARREFPHDVTVLRALAAFYTRHNQTPAVNVLLDRVGSDARRALTAGRFSPGHFEVLAAVFELRGRNDAAQVTQAVLAAIEGRPADLLAAGDRAFDPRLDDLLAPDVLTSPLRALLAKTGDALDQAAPIDLRSLKAAPLPADSPLARLATNMGQSLGLGPVQVLSSPKLGGVCLPVGSSPAAIVLGESAGLNERAQAFLVLRALKLVRARASALVRTPGSDLAVLLSAWLKCFNPGWQPQGVAASALNAVTGRLQAALPRQLEADVGVIALEVAGTLTATLGPHAAALGTSAMAWANRTALLAMGDPNAALDAIATAGGLGEGAPRDASERAAWLAKTPEARDLVAFGVTDAFAETRSRLGIRR